ncbi:hypothetical protein JW964_27450 [candidate division KSB1 bacterium]|nr:hypothetical protein [candidate division KSB1 bacterium]
MNTIIAHFQIIATLGPAVEQSFSGLIQAGATAFRLNCSHLSLDKLLEWLIKLEPIIKNKDNFYVYLDLQGSKMRIGELKQNRLLKTRERVTFSCHSQQSGDEIPLPHPEVFEAIQPGAKIQLDDGRIKLVVLEILPQSFLAEVMIGGNLSSHKGFVIDEIVPIISQMNSRDQEIIQETVSRPFVGYAISYLKNPAELMLYKKLIVNHPLVAKIERTCAFTSLGEIAALAESSWLCRGDLGVDASIYQLFDYEKKFIEQIKQQTKPYLIAGQVLENMVRCNYPSRSEITHLSYLLENGFSGVVLSDETAIGKFPLETVGFCCDFLDYFACRTAI